MRVFNNMTVRALLTMIAPVAILAPVAASAQTASVTFTGQLSGTDPLGGAYSAGPTGGGLVQFGEQAGLQSDPTQAVLFNPVGSILADATSFTLTITGSADGILPLDRDFGNYFETYAADGTPLSTWTAMVNKAGNAITYMAMPGEELTAGERFNTLTTFSLFNDLPGDFTYTITWTGDAAMAGVPEASTWSMMILGLGAVGVAVRRKRAVLKTA